MPQTSRSRTTSKARPYTARNSNGNGNGRKKGAPKGKSSATVVFVIILVLGVAIAASVLWARSFYGTAIVEGVSINGRDVGGMSADEARALIAGEIDPLFDKAKVRLYYGDQEWTMDAAALGMSTDLDEVIDQAAALGRTGSFSERRAQSGEVKSQPVDLTVHVTVDESALRAKLEQIRQQIDLPPTEAKVTFDPTMDDPATMFSISSDQPGNVTNVDATFEAVMTDLAGDWTADVEVEVDYTEATMTREFLSQYTEQVSYFGTHIKQELDDPRTSNISLALGNFNGLIIYPGESVSFNMMTGERTMAKGYQEAMQIASDKSLEPALGGGVCQASTTLYNAVMLAGLEIVERRHHSFPSSYVKEGFDATVNWPDKDFVFRNNTDGPIFLKAGVFKDEEGVNARVWVYGKPLPDGQYYERAWDIIGRDPAPDPEYKPDEDQVYVEKGVYYDDEQYEYRTAHAGLTIQTYRVLKDKDGNEIRKDELYLDEYKPVSALYYVGIVPASKRPPDVNHDGIPDVDSNGDGVVDMLDLDGDRVGDEAWVPPTDEEEEPVDGGDGEN